MRLLGGERIPVRGSLRPPAASRSSARKLATRSLVHPEGAAGNNACGGSLVITGPLLCALAAGRPEGVVQGPVTQDVPTGVRAERLL
jgi:hypothetical protein